MIPHLLFLSLWMNKEKIACDVKRWAKIIRNDPQGDLYPNFLFFMTFYPEFRNLCYYRMGKFGGFFNVFCRQMDTLFLATPEIGPGLFIQHGFSTIVAAKSIGANCWINQQVTIGYSNETDCPTLEDNVTVCAGAKVIGKATVGENSKIGANAVVVKDVPPNVTVVGIPARIVRRDGIRRDEPL